MMLTVMPLRIATNTLTNQSPLKTVTGTRSGSNTAGVLGGTILIEIFSYINMPLASVFIA
jgi:hypothetical protein